MRKVFMILAVFAVTAVYAGDGHAYVGTNSCKMCHKSEAKGNQFGQWEKSVHANALETLKNEASLAIAKKAGLTGPPSESPECLSCHTTGFGTDTGYKVLTAEFIADPVNAKAVKKNNSLSAVGCEGCHGPGKDYKSKKTMVGIQDGSIDGASVGLWTPDEAVCKTCHNEKSPTFKEFNFEERVKEFAHPYPAAG
ncbi:multiheme c-type cytochrome [Candidatus Neomarinimicrobiota bacterium]